MNWSHPEFLKAILCWVFRHLTSENLQGLQKNRFFILTEVEKYFKNYNMSEKHIYIRTRIDKKLKEECESVFNRLGLTTAEAVRIFLSQVKIHGGLPFHVSLYSKLDKNDDLLLPNKMRQAAIDTVYDD